MALVGRAVKARWGAQGGFKQSDQMKAEYGKDDPGCC